MTDYTKTTNFTAKDSLPVGDAQKKVKGSEFDVEFNAIATAVGTKANLASPTFTGTPSLPTGTTAVTQSADDNSTKLATTAYVDTAVGAIDFATVYPVGSIYINATNSTNPGTLLGFGTWVAFGAGRVMVGLNSSDTDFDTAEETGGAKTHTLTVDEMPSHTHTYSRFTHGGADTVIGSQVDISATYTTETTSSTGSGSAHNNLQPYVVVYMWKRTA